MILTCPGVLNWESRISAYLFSFVFIFFNFHSFRTVVKRNSLCFMKYSDAIVKIAAGSEGETLSLL